MNTYCGRFAPSPTGPLHLGSMAAAAASFLDARAHDGVWLVRIEDIDPFRDRPGAGETALAQLAAFGLFSDRPVECQSRRTALYRQALERLKISGRAYGCACTRQEIRARCEELGLPQSVYPGTCREGTGGRPVRSWRFRTLPGAVRFVDRRCGVFAQDVEREVGDFVLLRADGCWAYQLAAVVDDAAQGVTDVVRGEDLLDNTPRQLQLQEALGLSHPRYLHIPLVMGADGRKLSKQHGAQAVRADESLAVLERIWESWGFPSLGADDAAAFWKAAVPVWREKWVLTEPSSAGDPGTGGRPSSGSRRDRCSRETAARATP